MSPAQSHGNQLFTITGSFLVICQFYSLPKRVTGSFGSCGV